MAFFEDAADRTARLEAAKRLCSGFKLREELEPLLAQVKSQIPAKAYSAIASTTNADLVPVLAPVYAQKFSVSELGELAAFFGTPTGQRYLHLSPELAGAAQEAVNRFVMERIKGA